MSMKSTIKEETLKVEVKSEDNLDNAFLSENEHPVGHSVYSVVDEQVTANFKCKEEIDNEGPSETFNKFITENQQNVEEFSQKREDDEIDISETILQSSNYGFKMESENDNENQKAFKERNSPEDDHKEKKCHSTMRSNSILDKKAKTKICQFGNTSFTTKRSLDDHILKHHKQEIKGDLKSLITSKIHTCNICNSYETTNKINIHQHINSVHNEVNIKSKIYTCNICNSYETTRKTHLYQHINSVHNEAKVKMKCQFCTESIDRKQSLDGHLLRKYTDKIKNNVKSFMTSKIHICKICNSCTTKNTSNLDWHITSAHNKVKIKSKCEFCTKSFTAKRSLEDHVLRRHKDNIKNNVKSFITSKIHICKICNSYETTLKSHLDHHINSIHNQAKVKINCQFCTESFDRKQSLDGHLLRKHTDEIKSNLKSFITSKIHVCKICNSYETTLKSHLNHHINSVHNEAKVKMKCPFCTESFDRKQSLDGHLLRKHTDKIKNNVTSFITSKILVCKICNSYETTTKSSLDCHINSAHHKERIKMKCQFCTESFTAKRSLEDHVLRRHKGNIKNNVKSFITSKIHVCKICNSYETTLKSHLDHHINSIHNEAKVKMKCQFCTESFELKQSLDSHLLRKHTDKIKNNIKNFITSKIHVCKICNSYETTNKSNLDHHINSVHHKERIKMKCQFCTQIFIEKRSLDGHLLRKHTDKIKNNVKSFITSKILVCKICNSYETTTKSSLDWHINSAHHNERIKMKCQFCTESFTAKRSLEEHVLRRHKDNIKNNVKNFVTTKIHECKICNSFETTNKTNFDQHINSAHNKVKIKMKCHFCTESFISKISLQEHILRKHKNKIKGDIKTVITNKIHSCKICSFEFMTNQKLIRHINSVHNKKMKWKCEFCQELFKFKYTLNNHLLNQHNGEIEGKDEANLEKHLESNCHLSDKSIEVKKLHQNKERKKEIYICDICAYQTIRKHRLINHFNSVHNRANNKDFITRKIQSCKICSYQTTNTDILNTHIVSNHNNLRIIIERMNIRCHFCNEVFLTSTLLKEHMLKEHYKETVA